MTDNFVIAINVADVRREPNADAELVTQALMNVPVLAGEVAGEWTHVTLSDYSGWVRSSVLELPVVRGFCEDGEGVCGVPLPYSVVVTVPRTPLYCDADGTETKGEVYLSTVLPYIDLAHPRRLHVALPGDDEAWLERADVEVRTNTALFPVQPISVVTAYAQAFLGRPYLWGGTTWRGLDCSGFVQLCYRMGGVLLPRDAYQQHDVLTQTVECGHLRAGDLIFFGRRHITHVALALNGDDYIHAEGQEYHCVRIDSLNPASPCYNQRLAELVRVSKRVCQV